MQVRSAHERDTDSLFELNEQFNGKGTATREWIRDSILNNHQEYVFVAVIHNEAVGFCCVQLSKSMCYMSDYAEITELYVSEKHRNKKVATELFNFIEYYFSSRKIRDFQLLAGRNNKIAQIFYERLGYKKADEWMYRKSI